ncbi:MAG: YfiM family protein [Marinobacter sp.]|nr:YfiM family protein [Marinobacter sp.]
MPYRANTQPWRGISAILRRLLACTLLWRTMLIASVLAILYLATTPSPYPIPHTGYDKLNHLLAFVEVTLVLRLAFPRLPLIPVAMLAFSFGVAIELVQATLPHRHFSLADLAANAAGIGLGLLPWPGLPKGKKADHRHQPERV